MGIGLPTPEMINDAATGDETEPVFERAFRAIIATLAHLFGDGDDGFLHHVVRLGVGQAGFERDGVDQFPVSVEKVLPAFLVVPILEPFDEAGSGGREVFAAGRCKFTPSHRDKFARIAGFLQQKWRATTNRRGKCGAQFMAIVADDVRGRVGWSW